MSDIDHTCYLQRQDDCAACQEAFAASPAGIVTQAIETLGSEGQNGPLADLLQVLADEMSDEHAEEREMPQNIPAFRLLVCEQRGDKWYDRDRWTAALAVARSILGLPNPNAAAEAVA
jgi:hypothetical protein